MKYLIKAWLGLTIDERRALCLVLALLLLGLAAKYCFTPPSAITPAPPAPPAKARSL
jgi:hypothetical protein